MKRPSFWEEQAFGNTYDLVVVGAGIVGLSSALFYKFKHKDAAVLILDKGSIPEGASTRNAGFACTGSITEHVADLQKETEANIKKRIKRRYNGLQLLRKTLGDEAIAYENCGGYELFTEARIYEEAKSHISQFNKWMKALTGEQQVYESSQLNGYDVIYNRLEGALHPGKMMRSLIEKVQAAGATIYWKTPVEQISKSGEVVLQDKRVMEAGQVLAATNGFTQKLLPDVPVKPARGTVLVSEPWPDLPWQGTFHYDRGYIYFRNINGRLLLGGGRNKYEEQETVDQFGMNGGIKDYLQTFARETLRMPRQLAFEYEWSGIMGFTPTKTPILRRLDDHRVMAAGLSGMGIAIGMEVGQTAASLLNQKNKNYIS